MENDTATSVIPIPMSNTFGENFKFGFQFAFGFIVGGIVFSLVLFLLGVVLTLLFGGVATNL